MKEITLRELHDDPKYHWHGSLHSLPRLKGNAYECYTVDGVYYQAPRVMVDGRWLIDIENAKVGRYFG